MAGNAREFSLEGIQRFGPAIFVLLPIVAAGLLVWIVRSDESAGKTAYSQEASAAGILFLDPDEDGLKNWEEALYGTNPNNADTDADGLPDREEIIDGTPAVAGASAKNAENENLTETVLRVFFEKGGAIALSKGEQGIGAVTDLLVTEINRLAEEGALPRPIPIAPTATIVIQTSDDISPEAIRAYLNSAAEIIARESRPLTKDSVELLVEILRSQDEERLKEFAAYHEAAETIVKNLAALPAPKTLAWYHERQLFLLQEMASHMASFERTAADPLKTLAAVEQNLQAKEQLLLLNRDELSRWLAKMGVALSKRDAAYSFLY